MHPHRPDHSSSPLLANFVEGLYDTLGNKLITDVCRLRNNRSVRAAPVPESQYRINIGITAS